jgi:hypothetical protein
MRPPARFIRHRERKTAREPNNNVVVEEAMPANLSNPDIPERMTTTPEPLTGALEIVGNMKRGRLNARAVGESDEGGTVADTGRL